jgi:hypothetical protein
MSVIDTLITDRSALDITRREELKQKFINRAATAAEITEWFAGVKGAYNASDLNRVGNAVNYINDVLIGYGYSLPLSVKTDWVAGTIPTEAQMTTYLANIATLRDTIYLPVTVVNSPTSMNNLTYTDANNIETILAALYEYVFTIAYAFRHCGITICGSEGLI